VSLRSLFEQRLPTSPPTPLFLHFIGTNWNFYSFESLFFATDDSSYIVSDPLPDDLPEFTVGFWVHNKLQIPFYLQLLTYRADEDASADDLTLSIDNGLDMYSPSSQWFFHSSIPVRVNASFPTMFHFAMAYRASDSRMWFYLDGELIETAIVPQVCMPVFILRRIAKLT
jgi:hypothetical protein